MLSRSRLTEEKERKTKMTAPIAKQNPHADLIAAFLAKATKGPVLSTKGKRVGYRYVKR